MKARSKAPQLPGRIILLSCLAAFSQAARAAEESPAPGIATARVLEKFIQSSPATGVATTRRTEIRLSSDARTLFVDIRAFDPDPASIVARQLRRDAEGMLVEDQVTLVIDVEGAGRNGYLFAVNAHAAQFDALVYDGGQMRRDWDAQWASEAKVEPDGWRARLAIPLSVFGQSGPNWRVNAERWMPRGSERVRLAGAQPDKQVYSLGDAITIPAIRPEHEGLGLRIKPSLRTTATSSAASRTGRSEYRLEPGLELFHESRRGLRTTAALNIDFGEAEADERNVNLTRFELFLPEKREFFLRDAGRFTFGGLEAGAVVPYYSRRIGLDSEGHARGLDAGLKLTGSATGLDFGVLAARVEGGPSAPGAPDQSSANVAVLRVARPLHDRHRVGMLGTRGNPRGTSGSSLWGMDYQFRDTLWAGNKTLEANAWALQSSNTDDLQGAAVTGNAWGGNLIYLNIGPMLHADLQHIGARFDPALGYLAEANVASGTGTAGWWHRTEAGEDVKPAIDWTFRRTLDGQERSSQVNPEVEYTTAAGDAFMIETFHEQDRLAEGYALLPGVDLPAGRYQWHHVYGFMETSHSRPVWALVEARAGGYYHGRRNDQLVTVGWKPGTHWEANLGIGRNAIDLPSGKFTVKLATLRVDHTPSTHLTASMQLQWDNVAQSFGASARVRWMWAPGRDLIFGLDRLGYTGEQREFLPPQTRAQLKLVWNFER